MDWLPQPRKPFPPEIPTAREPSPPQERRRPPADRTWWPLIVILVALVLSMALFVAPFAIEVPGAPATVPPQPPPAPQVTVARPVTHVPESAALPEGDPVTPAGMGTWRVVAGASGPVAGTGAGLRTYTVEIEDGVEYPSFAAEVESILADPRGWIGLGDVSFRRVDGAGAPDFRVSLTSPGTSRRPDLCGFAIPYDSSCHLTREHRVVVNLARWVRGAHAYRDDLQGYHRYAINHEVGHALGRRHEGCPADGAPAPVMMQQTFGLSNTYVAELNRAESGAASKVTPDGAVCRPNPWVISVS
ncbi:DUF3152 domain-containing protein [Amycolatopsis sp. NPDC052450]|uniref:DUF3152 domain-containing protein n=1 Tax=Amycolatopsis sp. NPDC052450 TaxID=3363937 RepID=UPI0037C9CFDB